MKYLLPSLLLILIAFSSCRDEDDILTDSSVMLEFSNDTVIFDTVFTSIGSVTRQLRVYNRNDQAVNISSVYLADGASSAYRVNVNGDSGEIFSNVEIPADDSIFIFVEVTIDPNDEFSPFIESDSLIFEINGNVQDVDLVAFGQNAIIYYPQTVGQSENLPPFTCMDSQGNGVPCSDDEPPADVTWSADLPIVIYGYVIIDEDDRLNIEAGTDIYFYEGSGLWVFDGGHIEVNGTYDDPVTFQGIRLESDFDDVPGQWDLIRLYDNPSGEPNIFRHARIKNSIIGIEAQAIPFGTETEPYDPFAVSESPLILENTVIEQVSSIGLFTRNYRVEATNCLFGDAGQHSVGISGGGEYEFLHCTMADYWSFGPRSTPTFIATNGFSFLSEDDLGVTENIVRSDMSLTVTNCIIEGNTFEEFVYEFSEEQNVENILFDHCIIEVDETDLSDTDIFSDCISDLPNGLGFVAASDNDFTLTENSIARDAGSQAIFISSDLDGPDDRTDGLPDIGCLEWEEE